MSDNTNFTIVPPKEQPRSQLYHMSIRFKTDAGIKSLDELTDVCFPGQRVRAADALTLRMAQTVPFVPDEETLAKYAAAIEESYQTSKDAVISNVRFDGYDFIYAVTPAKSTQTKEKLK